MNLRRENYQTMIFSHIKSLYAHYLYKIDPIKGVTSTKKLNKIN